MDQAGATAACLAASGRPGVPAPIKRSERAEEEPWVESLGDEETSQRLEDLIPDAEGTEAWERLDADEQRDRLLSLIGELPPAQRQAFLLDALENYETAEIAMLQGRPESQAKADIKTALEGAARTPAGRRTP